jgi:DinB family protein
MTADERKKLIDQYTDGYRVVAEALIGVDDDELDARPAPAKWTAREVVHHLADSELTAATRLRLLVGTDNPQIYGYDQDQFANRLFYDRPIEASLDAFKTARRTTGEILGRMSEADWARGGTHTEHGGRYTPERWLEIYGQHAHRHAEQILVARGSAKEKT